MIFILLFCITSYSNACQKQFFINQKNMTGPAKHLTNPIIQACGKKSTI